MIRTRRRGLPRPIKINKSRREQSFVPTVLLRSAAKSSCGGVGVDASISCMTSASGVRIGWAELPHEVRSAVEAIIGGTVIEAVSQVGGFSPGTADRVRTADGRRAFVKAVSPAQNERSVEMHRREARVTAALPASVPAPQFLGCYDDGEWVTLVLQDIQGRHPATPWVPDELDRVLTVLDDLAGSLTPPPLPDLETAADHLPRTSEAGAASPLIPPPISTRGPHDTWTNSAS